MSIENLKNLKHHTSFYKNELQKTNKKKFSIEKVIQRKGHKLHVKWKDYNNSFNHWIDKKEYFAEPKSSGARVKVDLDLSNYATKADLKNATGVDTSKFAEKVDLVSLKSTVDELDTDKLKNVPRNLSNFKRKVDKLDDDKLVLVPVDLSKLIDVVKMMLFKKMYIMLISKKIPDITNLATTTFFMLK